MKDKDLVLLKGKFKVISAVSDWIELALRESILEIHVDKEHCSIPIERVLVQPFSELPDSHTAILKYLKQDEQYSFTEHVVDFQSQKQSSQWIETIQVLATRALQGSTGKTQDDFGFGDEWQERCDKISFLIAAVKIQSWWRNAGKFKQRLAFLRQRKIILGLQSLIRVKLQVSKI